MSILNRFLHPFGLRLVRCQTLLKPNHHFTMERALQRCRRHGFPIETFIDIGASEGKWSRQAAAVFPDSHFLALEPLEERRAVLEALRQTMPNFDYMLAMAGAVTGTGTINVAEDLIGSGSYDSTASNSRPVPMLALDDLVVERDAKPPFGLKFDTHGYELPILEGAPATLRQTELIIMEVYNFADPPRVLRFHQICAHMEALGFRCYDMCTPILRPRDGALWQMDLFFARDTADLFDYPSWS
jgi:FkbM family methyltransferase